MSKPLGRSSREAIILISIGVCAGAFRSAAPASAATLREPAFGLPHFYADTDVELARENGREIAKDRLGQIILLARVGRGTLYQVFGALDASTLQDDIEARRTAYTSSELNNMYAKLPERERDILWAYCEGVNDTIEDVYAGRSPEPLEVNLLRALPGLGADLFGNATKISDQVDPSYLAPGADPERPNAGFQFTPEMAMAIGILEVRNFGLESFDEPSRLAELQALVAKHGEEAGPQIWDDLNFLNDPLAPVSVPDPATPGFGGPLALRRSSSQQLVSAAKSHPGYDYSEAARRREEAAQHREEFARRWGAWPAMGSYAWIIAGSRSESGYPWLGGFPQTGIQTPSIMHFAENRTEEGIDAVGMEFAGAPFILIGHTDHVAWTTTTAQLRTVDTFFEVLVNEDTDILRYDDEGTTAELIPRTEVFRGPDEAQRVFWRSHARGGNGGSRSIVSFMGDVKGTADSGGPTSLVDAGAFDASLEGGYVAIVDGTGAGQMRRIAAVPNGDTLEISSDAQWQTAPDDTSVYVAVAPGHAIVASALDSAVWLEESTTVLGFSLYQRATDILGIRAGARLIPSTHNFLAADNLPADGIGTASEHGNIGYWSSGFSRVRRDGTDSRLPLDGTKPNPLVVVSGTIASAGASSLVATEPVFAGLDLAPPPPNFRYDNPGEQGHEYVVSITAGEGYKQTRRIASNQGDSLMIEYPWGVTPSPGDAFEVYEIVAMPEAINPAEGYAANWNNKAATADEGDDFGRQFRHIFILERLAADTSWNRQKQRQLNKDVAGLEGRGKVGRFLVPRLRQAVDAVGDGGNPAVDTVLARLEQFDAAPLFGRGFVDPVSATTVAGEQPFVSDLVDQLARSIFGDEFEGAVGVPGGARALNIVQHALDSAAGDLPGGYAQRYQGDYFNGAGWRETVRDTLSEQATQGIPDDTPRGTTRYAHPLAAVLPELVFEATPAGNRGTYEQIVEAGPMVRGEFVFPLGQSGLIEGSLSGVTSIDPNFSSLQPIWRDWRFAPMLAVSQDLAGGGNGDSDGDGVLDGYERWYFGDLSRGAEDDADGDGLRLVDEFARGSDAENADTDGDEIPDGIDFVPQDRLASPQCLGDCDGGGFVSIDELVRAVNIALGNDSVGVCTVVDFDRDGEVMIDELMKAVNVALTGCSLV
jgi:hypothetical protein